MILNLLYWHSAYSIGIVSAVLYFLEYRKKRSTLSFKKIIFSLNLLAILAWSTIQVTLIESGVSSNTNMNFIRKLIIIPSFYILLSIISLYRLKENKLKRQEIYKEDLTQYKLTPREKDVTELFVTGLSYKEIGRKLFISESTVKKHTGSILKKVGAKNRVELILLLTEPKTTKIELIT